MVWSRKSALNVFWSRLSWSWFFDSYLIGRYERFARLLSPWSVRFIAHMVSWRDVGTALLHVATASLRVFKYDEAIHLHGVRTIRSLSLIVILSRASLPALFPIEAQKNERNQEGGWTGKLKDNAGSDAMATVVEVKGEDIDKVAVNISQGKVTGGQFQKCIKIRSLRSIFQTEYTFFSF